MACAPGLAHDCGESERPSPAIGSGQAAAARLAGPQRAVNAMRCWIIAATLGLLGCGDDYYVTLHAIDTSTSNTVPTICVTRSKDCRGQSAMPNELVFTDLTDNHVVWRIQNTANIDTRTVTYGVVPTGWKAVKRRIHLEGLGWKEVAWPESFNPNRVYAIGIGRYVIREHPMVPSPADGVPARLCFSLAKTPEFRASDTQTRCVDLKGGPPILDFLREDP